MGRRLPKYKINTRKAKRHVSDITQFDEQSSRFIPSTFKASRHLCLTDQLTLPSFAHWHYIPLTRCLESTWDKT